ncbi:nucleotidyltransferase domain-containing protein [Deltaproteobacteria bacterium TL4]
MTLIPKLMKVANAKEWLPVLMQELKQALQQLYGDQLQQVVLYGSWARHQASDSSDIDLAVVLKYEIQAGLEIDRMIDLITDFNLKYNTLISIYPVSAHSYLTINSPLLLNIRKEGIPA